MKARRFTPPVLPADVDSILEADFSDPAMIQSVMKTAKKTGKPP
jgi:hypothetical protein|tara:strand:+ start:347 stop:478 length:132 start_codon:yes stop_codon:yes gene_type:complete